MLNLILKRSLLFAFLSVLIAACSTSEKAEKAPDSKQLMVSENGRFLAVGDNKPFFWLGDTGWLLFGRLTREETETYLENRKQKGFNVIQVMVLHSLKVTNAYGDSALINKNVATPLITKGNSFSDSTEYDFWDHVDFVIDKAAEKGIYMALVPVWGNNVKQGGVNQQQAKIYAGFLANRYKNRPNIIWLNGAILKAATRWPSGKPLAKRLTRSIQRI